MFRLTCWAILALLVTCSLALLYVTSRRVACHAAEHGAKELIAIGYPSACLLSLSLLMTLYTSLHSIHMKPTVDVAVWLLVLLCAFLSVQALAITTRVGGATLNQPCVHAVSATADVMGKCTVAAIVVIVYLLASWKKSTLVQKVYSSSGKI
tara:strand:+ start:1137 stop:1592 length:456 start_codon:yes stop_codon:yes gene_type:complete